jgi:hypothetical protein
MNTSFMDRLVSIFCSMSKYAMVMHSACHIPVHLNYIRIRGDQLSWCSTLLHGNVVGQHCSSDPWQFRLRQTNATIQRLWLLFQRIGHLFTELSVSCADPRRSGPFATDARNVLDMVVPGKLP